MSTSRKDLLRKLRIQKRELQQEVLMYRNVMESMRQNLAFPDMLKIIINNVTKGLGFDRAGIFLVSDKGDTIELVMGIDAKGEYETPGTKFPCTPVRGVHQFSDLVHGYEPFGYSNDVRKTVTKEVYEEHFLGMVKSCAQVPIRLDRNKIIGVLAVDTLFTQKRIKKTDLQVLMNFATQAAMAIESYRLHEKVTALTITDPLTGVYNRRYFDDTLDFEFRRALRYKRPLGLLYADLDHFKQVNDRWGHATGDEVLKQTAMILRSGVRNIDIVARIGGEEFAVILPDTNLEMTKMVAERLVKNVGEAGGLNAMETMTMSMGVASFPETAQDPKDLKLQADKSLYVAKQNGRNQVGFFALS